MKRYGFFSRKHLPSTPVQERHLWRAEEDAPISLTMRSVGDTAGGQRALVLGFAAVAVAGGAYFATVMLTHEAGRNNVAVASMTSIEAAPQPAAPIAEPVQPPAEVAAPAPAESPALAESIVHDITSMEASAATPPATAPEPADEATTTVVAQFPEPVRVKTIQIMPTKTGASGASTETSAPETAARQDRLDPNTQVTAALAKEPLPAYASVSAYAEANASKLVSEGIEAVLRQVATEKTAPVKKKTIVASTEQPAAPVVSEAPEMAGGMRPARIRSGVNMRARPASGAQVVGTIPSNATVSIAPGCRHWCEVTYKGQRGYIYKSFVR